MYDWISKNGDEVGLFFSSSETLVLFVYVRFDMKQKNDPTRSCLFFFGGGGAWCLVYPKSCWGLGCRIKRNRKKKKKSPKSLNVGVEKVEGLKRVLEKVDKTCIFKE